MIYLRVRPNPEMQMGSCVMSEVAINCLCLMVLKIAFLAVSKHPHKDCEVSI